MRHAGEKRFKEDMQCLQVIVANVAPAATALMAVLARGDDADAQSANHAALFSKGERCQRPRRGG